MKFFPLHSLSAAVLLLTLLPAAAQKPAPAVKSAVPAAPAAGNAVLGRIGELEVTVDEVRTSLAGLAPAEAAAISKDPALLNQVVRSLLVQRVLQKEALEKGWDKEPSVLAQVERIKQSTITESYLQSVAAPPEGYPGAAELQAAYETAKPALLVPKSWRLAQIFVADSKDAADKEASANASAKLETVKKALKAGGPGADFAKLAAVHSDEAQKGSEPGWLAENQIQPEIRAKVAGLALNTVSEPVRLADGWHILKVLDVREAYTPTLDQVRGQLAAQMRLEKTRANSQAYLAKLLQDNPLAINELELNKVLSKERK